MKFKLFAVLLALSLVAWAQEKPVGSSPDSTPKTDTKSCCHHADEAKGAMSCGHHANAVGKDAMACCGKASDCCGKDKDKDNNKDQAKCEKDGKSCCAGKDKKACAGAPKKGAACCEGKCCGEKSEKSAMNCCGGKCEKKG